MEAHECICLLVIELTLDGILIHTLGNRVVDIKKSNDIITYACSDVLA